MEDSKRLLQVLIDLLNEDVDWIEERKKCSPQEVWKQLRDRLVSDVDKIRSSNQLPISVEPDDLGTTIAFFRTFRGFRMETAVSVSDGTVTYLPSGLSHDPKRTWQQCEVRLSDATQCRIYDAAGKEYRIWEFSRMLLEPLLEWKPSF